MAKNKNGYCIGLDIGTNSVGWAMTDTDAKLLKHKKRSTFGAVLFDGADTAADRRAARSARRRLDRREQRIDLLQMLMNDEIAKVDPLFFIRLNETFLHEEDRKYPLLYGTLPSSVWLDGSPSEYKTVYHLRRMLITEDKPADIRYIYLAMHHIIKYRGHFLLQGEKLDSGDTDIPQKLGSILLQLKESNPDRSFLDDAAVCRSVYEILLEHNLSKSVKAANIVNTLQPDKETKKALTALAKLLVGLEGSLKELFGYDGETPPEKLDLSSEWNEEAYINALGVNAEVFSDIVEVYRWQVFVGLRMPGETISQTMIRRYEKHQKDLKRLKEWYHKYMPDRYDEEGKLISSPYSGMFRDISAKAKNYCAYTRHFDQQKQAKGIPVSNCSQKEFYKTLKDIFTAVESEEAKQAAVPFLKAMDNDNGFLPLLRIYLNGSVPNQLQAEELSLILDRQGRYYPSLLENKDRIMSLCTFRLPYYVGPLNRQSPFQKWLVRDDGTKVYPWNFYDVVDKEKTADGFIRNLTNKCTYLPTEDVLPLHSLLYEEFALLDELNRVRINGKLITKELKEQAIEELFGKYKTVTAKRFTEWLEQHTAYAIGEKKPEISGYHAEDGFACSLGSRIDFSAHGFVIDDASVPMIEDLIRWSTVFEDRTILREKITAAYPELTSEQVNFVVRKRYTGWGRLSRTLLDGITGDELGENMTVIEMMRATNDNFMKVINRKDYGFGKAIDEFGASCEPGPVRYEEVQALQGSPALKRGIWQAVKIVDELIRFNDGRMPAAIYIENTRGEDKGKKGRRIPDRIAAIEKYYSESPSGVPAKCKEELAQCKADKIRLNERQFLYFLQQGRCLYSGEPLSFDQLSLYDVDHILPQSYIKDDSVDNKALVLSRENRRKSGDRLLSPEVIARNKTFWLELKKAKLMSPKKFANLTRAAVEDYEMLGFINRQLVETSQIIKHIVSLFKAHYPETGVHAVNARISSALRDEYDLYKVREINDTHHAYDAFLACVAGTFTDRFFSWLSDESVAANMARSCWLKTKERDSNGIVLSMFGKDQVDEETGEIIRNADSQIAYLKKVWAYRDHFISYRCSEKSGEFWNQTKYPAGSKEATIPLKKDLPVERYGGYSSMNPAFVAAVTYQKGKKRLGTFVNVPVYLSKAINTDPGLLAEYVGKAYGMKDVRIVRPKIMLDQLFLYDGSNLLVTSATEFRNGKQLYLSPEQVRTVRQIYDLPESAWQFTEEDLTELIRTLLSKLENNYPIYAGVSARIREKLPQIVQLSIPEKVIFIQETLKVMMPNKMYAMYKNRLPALGLSDNQGRLTNKPIDLSGVILIDRSVTGLYERRVRLWASEQS